MVFDSPNRIELHRKITSRTSIISLIWVGIAWTKTTNGSQSEEPNLLTIGGSEGWNMNILKVSYKISEYMPSIRQFESTLKFILPIYAILTFKNKGIKIYQRHGWKQTLWSNSRPSICFLKSGLKSLLCTSSRKNLTTSTYRSHKRHHNQCKISSIVKVKAVGQESTINNNSLYATPVGNNQLKRAPRHK